MIGKLFKRPRFNFHFNDGAFVEIESGKHRYAIEMSIDGKLIHQDELPERHWTKSNRQYFSPWVIDIYQSGGKKVFTHTFDPTGQRIRVNIDSKSLGDTLAWLPQVQAFARKHSATEVYISHFWPDLFEVSEYPELHYLSPDDSLDDCYATYNIGYFFDNSDWYHPEDLRLQPLAKIASDILGMEYVELRPKLKSHKFDRKVSTGVVTLAQASTAACKFWNYPGGWQQVVDHLVAEGFQVNVIQKETSDLKGVTNLTGDHPIGERIRQVQESDFFIGLGSGLSWLAWALEKPVVLISGFSEPWAEFEKGCFRVINQNVCHGCWNDPAFVFDRDDWNWCPRLGGTERQFECTKEITPEMVIQSIRAMRTNHSL